MSRRCFDRVRSAGAPVVCLAGFLAVGAGRGAEPVDHPRNEVVHAPMEWAAAHFAKTAGTEPVLVRRELDLDHDDEPELFVGDASQQSQNGIPFVVFKRSGDGYRYLGDLFCDRDFDNIRVLPLGADGSIRIASSWHVSADESVLALIGYDGTAFKTLKTVRRNRWQTPPDARTLEEVFEEP